ncbi:hypothetical protein [Sphingomonas sp. R1]|uniref:hypothetical protein n=1 Tax=Sphingomonas sp. R1 TaxID=399176 RepID=UPI002224B95B|nr:hypothetical protein [Sphingomonas sp. R1]UYY77476.1 hypothetical protein OIM94_00235 [Sphingomonas sp. R1]
MSDWIVPEGEDVLRYRAFVYRVTLPDGRWYIGKKNVYRMKEGKIVGESNWRDYWSSSKEVKAAAKSAGYANCRREILRLTESTGKAGYIEERMLMSLDAMLDPLCMNGNVAAKYQRKVVQGWHSDERCERYMRDTEKQRRAAGLLD